VMMPGGTPEKRRCHCRADSSAGRGLSATRGRSLGPERHCEHRRCSLAAWDDRTRTHRAGGPCALSLEEARKESSQHGRKRRARPSCLSRSSPRSSLPARK
jgi:hypothetical protein